MRIPLPKMMRQLARARVREAADPGGCTLGARDLGLGGQASGALPARHARCGGGAAGAGRQAGPDRVAATGGGWTGQRDFPAPQGGTFMAQWKARAR